MTKRYFSFILAWEEIKMLYVKEANLEDFEKECAFVRDMPEDEFFHYSPVH